MWSLWSPATYKSLRRVLRGVVERNRRYQRVVSPRGVVLVVVVLCGCVSVAAGSVVCPGACNYIT